MIPMTELFWSLHAMTSLTADRRSSPSQKGELELDASSTSSKTRSADSDTYQELITSQLRYCILLPATASFAQPLSKLLSIYIH